MNVKFSQVSDPTKWDAGTSALWTTPDGSIITEASTTPRGRIVVRTDSGKTYIVPKCYMKRIVAQASPTKGEQR